MDPRAGGADIMFDDIDLAAELLDNAAVRTSDQ